MILGSNPNDCNILQTDATSVDGLEGQVKSEGNAPKAPRLNRPVVLDRLIPTPQVKAQREVTDQASHPAWTTQTGEQGI